MSNPVVVRALTRSGLATILELHSLGLDQADIEHVLSNRKGGPIPSVANLQAQALARDTNNQAADIYKKLGGRLTLPQIKNIIRAMREG